MRLRRALRRWLLSDPNLGVAYVQLVGLTTVASHRAHWASSSTAATRRAAWLVILIGGCCLATFYMVIQVSLYLAGHVGVSVSPSSNTTTQLPAVTICVEQKYDFHNLLWLWRKYGPGGHMPGDADLQLLDHANLTLSYIWRHGGYKLDSLIKECLFGPGNSCEDKGSWLPVFTEYGLCYTYSGGYTRLDGHMYGLYIKMNYSGHPYGLPFQGFKVVVHDARSPAVVRINDGFLCPVKENKFGCFIMQSVEMKTITLLRRKDKTCESRLGYNEHECFRSCIYGNLTRMIGCRLPYMEGPQPECRGRTQVERAMALTKNQIFFGGFNVSLCNCPQSCQFVLYREHSDTTWSHVSTSTIKVYLASIEKSSLTETYTYLSDDLAGDIGGIIGLMLGASVITTVQLLEVVCCKGCRTIAAHLKSPKRQMHIT